MTDVQFDAIHHPLNLECASLLKKGDKVRIEIKGYEKVRWTVKSVQGGKVWVVGWSGPLDAQLVHPWPE